jgi:membrane associated rhomboid family serine protease
VPFTITGDCKLLVKVIAEKKISIMPTNLILPFDTMPATIIIMVVILIFSVMGFRSNSFYLKMIHHPASVVNNKQYHRLFTSDLVHNDFMHLLVNEAMALFICGNLEEVLRKQSVYGTLEFIFIYLLSHFAGVVLTTIRHRNDFEYSSAGASGSVLGCMMAFMILKPDYIGLYVPIAGGLKNIYVGLIVIVGLIIYQRRTGNPMMDNELHFYSALGGIAASFILFPHLII